MKERERKGVHRNVGVLLSGGVDSSVAAHLLLQEGFSISGVFITIRNPSHIPCTTEIDQQDAMRACAALNIPFIEYDATDIYQKKVIDPFVEAYRRGETPNPDVLCNQFVKFDAAFSFMQAKGFDYIATGHYGQVRVIDGMHRLCQSVDTNKDQTYFMYAMPQKALNKTLLPIGKYTKQEVRKLAHNTKLPAAKKKDSTGLCFLGAVSMQDFLSAYIKPKQGDVCLFNDGTKVGTHNGVWFYTPGQRHGFTITNNSQGPYVVVDKDMEKNTLMVQKGNMLHTNGHHQFTLKDTMFRRIPKKNESLVARYRHQGDLHPVSISMHTNSIMVTFTKKHVIANGQPVVLYGNNKECLGGGIVLGQPNITLS